MRSGPIAAAALLCLTLLMPGCGEEGTATAGAEKVTTKAQKQASGPRKSAAAKRCGRALGDLLDSMESLGNTLAVGLEYEQYLDSVHRVRASYASVDAGRLGLVCLGRVAGPAEEVLNTYIDAANEWGDCLADPACDSERIEPSLQRRWEEAADLLAQARDGLRTLG